MTGQALMLYRKTTANWDADFLTRYNHKPKRAVRLRREPMRWAHSMLREIGDYISEAWRPLRAAI